MPPRTIASVRKSVIQPLIRSVRFMADPFYATSVSAGKCAFSSMAWSDTTLEENGITEVEEIEVLFRAYDADDFMGEDFANEVITLNP